MTRIMLQAFAAFCLGAAGAAPLAAETASITLRNVNRHPLTAAQARHVFARIDEAALRVCGGSGFSLSEVKDAMRASPCWQDAVFGAVREIDSPALTQALSRYRTVR